MKSNLAVNLAGLRRQKNMSQEQVAETVGVSRQALAKWETGESSPDIVHCQALAELYGVSLDDLVHHNQAQEGVPIGPKGKYLFGTVTLGERGQVVIPKKAREVLQLKPGDTLVVLGDTNPGSVGIALVPGNTFLSATKEILGKIGMEGTEE